MNLVERMQKPTPPLFKKVRRVGMILAAVSGAILAAPAALPAVVVTIAGYLGVIGAVATAVSQAATEESTGNDMKKEDYGLIP